MHAGYADSSTSGQPGGVWMLCTELLTKVEGCSGFGGSVHCKGTMVEY